jgi:hypothetical protein
VVDGHRDARRRLAERRVGDRPPAQAHVKLRRRVEVAVDAVADDADRARKFHRNPLPGLGAIRATCKRRAGNFVASGTSDCVERAIPLVKIP